MLLHQAICVFARHAGLCEIEEELSAENQAAAALEVLQHAIRINQECVDQASGFVQQVIHENCRIGKNNSLNRRMRDVALVPQWDILQCCLRIRAHYACQSADLFACDRIALVRHG